MGFLQKALNRALDDKVNNIALVDLLKEIETLAVVRQSNIANTLQPWCSVQPDNHLHMSAQGGQVGEDVPRLWIE
jgi:hypothetical protein